MIRFPQPPILRGSESQQLQQLRQYLYGISRDLTAALHSLTAENFAPDSKEAKILSGKTAEEQQKSAETGLSSLKSLIVKTADTVEAELQKLETELHGSYVAQSEFGTFSESVEGRLTAAADALSQQIRYQAQLSDDLSGLSSDFTRYVVETGGYIKQGIIGYRDGVPVIGIAIGQDIQVTGTDEKDGIAYEVIDTASNMSVWTPDKLAFYVNGMEAAYVSNGAFYAADMYVLSRLFLGQNHWQLSSSRGLTIKWIGG